MSAPLENRRILVTRALSQAASFSTPLRELGAKVVEVPTIEIIPTPDAALDQAIHCLDQYSWLFFTSPNGVEVFFQYLEDQHADCEGRWPDICCIGPATSQAVEDRGLTVSFQPELYQAEGIIEEFAALNNGDLSNLRILLPRARVAREVLPEKLSEMGAKVDLIPIYETVLPAASETALKRVLAEGHFDLITFTSSSTVRNFVSLAGDSADLTSFDCAAIGPITAETARKLGFRVVLQPESATIPDFVRAIRDYLTV